MSKNAAGAGSGVPPTPATNAPQTDQVSISGQALMLSRLFGSTDPNDAPPVETGVSLSTEGDSVYNFLTEDDRNTLSDMYAYAQQQGASLQYVDDIAHDLGVYREFGSVTGNTNSVGTYDASGHAITYSFTDQDAVAAQNILGGDAINSTRLDPGFLKFELDPGYMANHAANFDFLEQMVNHFSGAGANTQQSLDSKFSTFVPNGESNFVTNVSSEVVFQAPQPDTTNTDGVWAITEKGAQDGFAMQNGVPVQTKSSGQVVESEQDKVNTTVADAALGLLNQKKPASPSTSFDFLEAWRKSEPVQKKGP
jgi:hypothetical protein